MLLHKITREMQSRKMIRNRGAYEYEEDLGIDVVDIAVRSLKDHGKFVWYDMCCGQFNAGRDVHAATNGEAVCVGVDAWTLLDEPIVEMGNNLRIERGDVVTHNLPSDIDLITCDKGLRYVELSRSQ